MAEREAQGSESSEGFNIYGSTDSTDHGDERKGQRGMELPDSARFADLMGGGSGTPGPSAALLEAVSGFERREEPIGRGGEGLVFEARRKTDGERVAMKIVSCGERAASVRRAFETLARLDHPNIVKARDIVADADGFVVLTMDFVEGVDLSEHLARMEEGRTRRAVEVGACVARALDYCHKSGVFHRDVKPQNILIRMDDRPVLVDFGTARDVKNETQTKKFEYKGTIGFMAPEQTTPGLEVDERTDVFALGRTLHLLLTGQYRFESPAELVEACRDAARGEPVRPEDLARVLARATELEPRARFKSAAELALALEALLAGREPDPVPSARRGLLLLLVLVAVAGTLLVLVWLQRA